MDKPILAVVAIACAVAAMVWGRSARYLRKVELRLETEPGPESDATILARSQFRKELHTTLLYGILAGGVAGRGVLRPGRDRRALRLRPHARRDGAGLRAGLHPGGPALRGGGPCIERRAEEVLSQEELAPQAVGRAACAPEDLPECPATTSAGVPARHRPAGRRLLRRLPAVAHPPGRRSSATSPATASSRRSPRSRPRSCCGSSSASTATRPRRSRC